MYSGYGKGRDVGSLTCDYMWHSIGSVLVTLGKGCESIFGVMQGISSDFNKHQGQMLWRPLRLSS